MLKNLKKTTSFLIIIAVVLTMFYGINVSGASATWSPSKGSPTINDIDDGYTDFRVNSAAAMWSNELIDLTSKDIFIKNFEIPEKTYWMRLSFCQNDSQVGFENDLENGGLNLYVQADDSDSAQYQLFFFDGAQHHLGKIKRTGNLSVRFIKTSKGNALQVNGTVIYHDFITTFCSGNFHKKTRINFSAYNWASGQVKLCDREWEFSSSSTPAVVYKNQEKSYSISAKADDNKVYSTQKISFATKKMVLSDMYINDDKKIVIGLDAEDKITSQSDIALGITPSGNELKVTLEGTKETVLGTVPKASEINISVSEDSGKHYAVVNGAAFDCGEALNIFKNSGKDAYVSFVLAQSTSFSVRFSDLKWVQFAGGTDAVIELTRDNGNHLEVVAGQGVRAPEVSDIFRTGVVLSNLDFSGLTSAENGFYICFSKKLDKAVPSKASENELTFFVKKSSTGISVYMLDSNNKKVFLCEADESEKYNFSISLFYKFRTLKINDTHYRLDKLGDDAKQVVKDIEKFLGTEEKVMAYVAFSANDNIKADLDLFSFEKPVIPTGFSVYNGKTYNASGDETKGYAVKEAGEAYVVSNSLYSPVEYALYGQLNNTKNPLYFALSATDVSDTEFWVCGNGSAAKRFVFVITPDADNQKATISYYGADGVNAEETVIDTVDFDWSAKHSFDVRKSTDGNWYINIDAYAVDKVASVALNDFMQENSDDELFYIIGGKKGIDVKGLKLIRQQVTPVIVEKEGWSFKSGSVFDLEKDANGFYALPSDRKVVYAFRNGTENITETSIKLNLKDIKANSGKKFLYFAISYADINNTKSFLPKGTIDEIDRVAFKMVPDFENSKLAIYKFNDDAAGAEDLINTIDYEFGVDHIFDIRPGSDGNWYLCIDDKPVLGSVFNLLQQFIERYGNKALYYGVGAYGTPTIDGIGVMERTPGEVYIDTETWHTTSGILLEGNDKEGYGLRAESNTYTFSDNTYDMNSTSLKFSINDVGTWIYFSISTTDYTDTATLPALPGDEVNRIVLLLAAFGDTVQLQHWAVDGSSKVPTVITSYQFDWLGTEHCIDIRQIENDDNWYFCVDGRMILNKVSPVVNAFMEKNKSKKMHYGLAGWGLYDLGNIRVVDKQPVKGTDSSDEDYADGDFIFGDVDFGFEFEFDNVENENVDTDFEFDFNEDSNYESEEENTVMEINPLDYLQKVKVKKRRLVSPAHGMIFTTFEKVAMVAGAVVAVGAITLLVVLIIKKSKKKGKN